MNKQALVSAFTTVGGVDSDQKYIDVRMNAIKRKILIVSGKGGKKVCVNFGSSKNAKGVGKSSIAAGLSMALAQLCGEKKVLLDLI